VAGLLWNGKVAGFRLFDTHIKQRGLLSRVLVQFLQIVYAALGFLLLALVPALRLFPLSLLPGLFFLSFGKS
jgi:hypothetical protein